MFSSDRRTVMRSLLALAAGGVTPAGAAGAVPISLSTGARRSGRVFGAAVRLEHLAPENPLRPILLRECDTLTPETALKWAAMEVRPGVLDFTTTDRLADFAVLNGKRLRGHTLLWHRSIPAWGWERLAGPRGWGTVDRFFASVIPRYGNVIDSWDVVNEPIEPATRADGLRESPFLAAFGPSYVERALRQARAYAPRAALAINEYGLDLGTVEDERRRTALLRLVAGLRGRGVPLDVVGLQAHLDLSKGPFVERTFDTFLDDLAATGVRIAITELDVKEANYVASPETRDRAVADIVERYLAVALAHPAMTGVTTWGISDATSWLTVSEADRARFPGAWMTGPGPGLNRGLPYDAALRPKPMYRAIDAAFHRAGSRG